MVSRPRDHAVDMAHRHNIAEGKLIGEWGWSPMGFCCIYKRPDQRSVVAGAAGARGETGLKARLRPMAAIPADPDREVRSSPSVRPDQSLP